MNTEKRNNTNRIVEQESIVIIVECDEEQKSYKQNVNFGCEQVRMKTIAQSFDGKKVYFIVWNPYTHDTGTKKHVTTIDERYDYIDSFIGSIIHGRYTLPQTGYCYVIYMFYDEWNGIDHAKWYCLSNGIPGYM